MEQKAVRPFGVKDKFCYMMGDVGCNMLMSFANSYLLVFYTKVMGVTGAIVGTVFMVSRIVDAFTDMGMGRIVDTHANRRGDRFRPWIALASIPAVITSCAMYNYWMADAAMAVKVIWLFVTYLLFGSIFYTAINVPYGAMSAALSSDAGHRASLSTWRNVGANTAGVVLGVVMPLVVYVKDENGNDIADGPRFFMASVIFGVIALVALLLCWWGCTERVKLANKQQVGSSNSSLQVILACLKNRAVITTFACMVFIYAAQNLFTTFNQYIFLDYFGNAQLSGASSLLMFAGMMVAAPLSAPLSKKFGKKEVGCVGLVIAAVFYAMIFLLRVENPIVYLIMIAVVFFGWGLEAMISFAMLNDCADDLFLRTGDRADGTIYGFNSFMKKLAAAICVGAGGWGLTLIHYDELAAVQTEGVRQALFSLSVGLPALMFVLAAVSLFFYPLNKRKVDENTRKLALLRSEDNE